jgi:hypothetical protein
MPCSRNAVVGALASLAASTSSNGVGAGGFTGHERNLQSVDLVEAGILPTGAFSHLCIVTGWNEYNATLQKYASLLGQAVPTPDIAGGLASNGTYLGRPLEGTTKIAFLHLNNFTRVEFLAGDPDKQSWWREVYDARGEEVHHMGYQLDEVRFDAVFLAVACCCCCSCSLPLLFAALTLAILSIAAPPSLRCLPPFPSLPSKILLLLDTRRTPLARSCGTS